MKAMTLVLDAPAIPAATRGAAPGRARPSAIPAPETLHPALWLGHQLGRQTDHAVSSGFAALDAQLPGGGWPRRVLTELLLPHPGVGEIRLLCASLAAVQQAGRLVMMFDPPHRLSAWALTQLGLDVAQLLVVHTRCKVVPLAGRAPGRSQAGPRPLGGPADVPVGRGTVIPDSLWALEQALKSGHVGAIVGWLPPRLRAERLRRLQLAAQAHDGPAFVLREMAAQQRPTAAPLRLALRAGGADTLELRLLKRRGPPLAAPLTLDLPPVLSAGARHRAEVPAHRPMPLQSATFINLAA